MCHEAGEGRVGYGWEGLGLGFTGLIAENKYTVDVHG